MKLQLIQHKIYEVRGHKVMLDFDLAALYEVETRALNQSVKRNIKRFPPDFMFQLTEEELESLRSQFVISNFSSSEKEDLRLQIATSNRGGKRYLPYAFTEQGLAMLSGILNSQKAIDVNIMIMRAFVHIRQWALTHKELTEALKKLEDQTHKKFKDVYEALNYLLQKDKADVVQKQRKKIGFRKEN